MWKTITSLVCGLLLLCSTAYAATWVSGTVASIEPYGDGQLLLVMVWTDDQGAQDKSSLVIPPGAAVPAIQAELTKRNAREKAIKTDLKVGTVVRPADVIVVDPEPTEDDLAVTAFQVKVVHWRSLQIRSASTPDIETAFAAMITDYDKASAPQKVRYDQILVVFAGRGI